LGPASGSFWGVDEGAIEGVEGQLGTFGSEVGELSCADFGAEGDGLVGVVTVGDFGSVFDEVDCFGVG